MSKKVVGLAICAVLLTLSFLAEAQQPRVPRVGYIFATTSSEGPDLLKAVREGLRELGYVEGRTIALEVRWAEGRYERLPTIAAELVHLKVDVLVVAATPGALAAKNATKTIPIVFTYVADPAGLVASLARPGGNVTGPTTLAADLSGKRLELIKEYVLRGGGLVMAGGYLSFQGIYGAARYSKSPIEDVLPVALLPVDDRVEKPEGVNPRVIDNTHFITERIQAEWPYLLGFNEVSVKKGADLLVKVQDHPLLVVGSFGKGRSVAWTSDIGPHWCPKEFVEWPGYGEVWVRIVQWAAQGRGEG